MFDLEGKKALVTGAIVVQKMANGKFKVLEANCRTVCFRSLQAMPKFKDQTTWDTIPARVVPKDVEERKVAILLADQHALARFNGRPMKRPG